jgi:hypothetical protein
MYISDLSVSNQKESSRQEPPILAMHRICKLWNAVLAWTLTKCELMRAVTALPVRWRMAVSEGEVVVPRGPHAGLREFDENH